jgi:hypothetical protein
VLKAAAVVGAAEFHLLTCLRALCLPRFRSLLALVVVGEREQRQMAPMAPLELPGETQRLAICS